MLQGFLRHFKKNCLTVALHRFRTVLAGAFPAPLVHRVWDCFFLEGWPVVFRVILTLLRLDEVPPPPRAAGCWLLSLLVWCPWAFAKKTPKLLGGQVAELLPACVARVAVCVLEYGVALFCEGPLKGTPFQGGGKPHGGRCCRFFHLKVLCLFRFKIYIYIYMYNIGLQSAAT